jgi:hypothetical protein
MASGGKEKRRRGKIKVASQHRVPPCDMARTEREELTILQTLFFVWKNENDRSQHMA